MTREDLATVLEQHRKWINNEEGAKRLVLCNATLRGANLRSADLRGASLRGTDLRGTDLRGANLSGANLRRASMSGANMSEADLHVANLSSADLSGADLSDANLHGTDICWADMSGADLRRANMICADLSSANLRVADLRGADLDCADLRGAYLSGANLHRAYLLGANLSGANLCGANLSGTFGLPFSLEFIEPLFECSNEGFFAYKVFGMRHPVPDYWDISPGSTIYENVNTDRTFNDGCGINIAPRSWIAKNIKEDAEVWKVFVDWRWIADSCVPYGSDGTIRCGKVQLVDVVSLSV